MTAAVLIVDDDPFIRRLIATTLEDLDGYVLREAGDGEAALVIIAGEEPPALVFLDVTMPKLDGLETCRQLRADPATAGARIVMLPAASGPEAEGTARAAGCDLYLTKPFSPLELLRLVEHLAPATG